MAHPAKEKYIVDEKGKPTAVILGIERYREMLALVQERSDRRESKFLSRSRQFRKLVHKGLKEIKESKVNPWKEVWNDL